jgi:MarR family transcriptional regulator, 2-MHQ and catechol-resistance regulon repressor
VEASVSAYVRLVRSAQSLHAEVSKGLSPFGLTASQFSTLKALRMRGPLAQRDIAEYLLKTGGNVTVVVDNLEKLGLVSRLRGEADRRTMVVTLTPKGSSLFDRAYGPHLEGIRHAMDGLTEAECEQLIRLLDKLAPTSSEPCCSSLAN